jgi:CRP-like cAMP-binding protein
VIRSFECVLDPELAEKIIERSVETIPHDGVLYRQGDQAINLYFVKSGAVTVTLELAGRRDLQLVAGTGSLLGLAAVITCQPHQMTGEASRNSVIYRLSSDAFHELLETEPRMQAEALRILACEVRTARQALSDLLSELE